MPARSPLPRNKGLFASFSAEKEDSSSRNNAFGSLRLFFAILVIFSHSFALTSFVHSPGWFAVTFPDINLGYLAVSGFFAISGYLISLSYQASPSVFAYADSTAKRIKASLPRTS